MFFLSVSDPASSLCFQDNFLRPRFMLLREAAKIFNWNLVSKRSFFWKKLCKLVYEGPPGMVAFSISTLHAKDLHGILSIKTHCHFAECCYAECRIIFVVILNVTMCRVYADSCGLYYKHIMIVNDASRVISE